MANKRVFGHQAIFEVGDNGVVVAPECEVESQGHVHVDDDGATVLAANAGRVSAEIVNPGPENIYIGYGETPVYGEGLGPICPGGSHVVHDGWRGSVIGITASGKTQVVTFIDLKHKEG